MMQLSRRSFLGLSGAMMLTACARRVPLIGNGNANPWAVAAISDLHVKDARSTAIINRAVNKINATPQVRLTVAIGDLATDGQLSELNLAKQSLDRLDQPFLAVPGNHDLFMRAPDPYANFKNNFGPPNWVHRERQWTFIGLDSCDGTASDVAIRPEVMAWLDRRLRRIKPARPVGLFVHHPFGPSSKAYRVKNADEVIAMFSGHNLRFVASGHYHGNQEEIVDGVLYTTTACCASTRDNHDGTAEKGYRLFRIEGEDVTTQFVPV